MRKKRRWLDDIGHIFLPLAVIGFTSLAVFWIAWKGAIIVGASMGFLYGYFMEAKERNSAVFKARFSTFSKRDLLGYTAGGVLGGLVVWAGLHLIVMAA